MKNNVCDRDEPAAVKPGEAVLNLLDQLFGNISSVFYIMGAEGDFTLKRVSQNIARILDVQPESCLAKGAFWRERIHPDDVEQVMRELGALKEAGNRTQEFRLRNDAGSYLWIRNEVAYKYSDDGDEVFLAGCVRDIGDEKECVTEFVRHEEMQRAREHFYRSVLDSLPQRLFWKDRNSVFRGCNQGGASALNLNSPDEIVGKSDYDFYADQEKARYLRTLDEQVMNSGKSERHSEVAVREGDAWLDVSKIPLCDVSGKVYGLLVCYEDVSVLKKSEMALNKFKRAVEQSYNSVFITDMAGNIEYVNPEFLATYGYELHEVIGQTPQLLKSGLMSEEIYRDLWQTVLSGRHWRGELSNRKKDGALTWQSVSISPIVDALGAITHFLAIEDDITEHKMLESGLKQELEFNQQLIDSLPHPVFFKDVDGRYLRVNHAFEKFAGLGDGEACGKTVFNIFPQELAVALAASDENLCKCGGLETPEFRMVDKDGVRRDIITHKNLLVSETGEVTGILGSYFDITERKRVEAALAENEARLRELTSTVGEGIYVVNAVQVITFVNPAAVNLLGWDDCELLGSNVHRIFDCRGETEVNQYAAPCCMAESVRRDLRTFHSENEFFLRKDGTQFPVSVIASPIIRDGSYAGSVFAFHDITEQKFTQVLLNSALKELRTVTDNVQVGLAYLRGGKFSWINTHMGKMFGYSVGELQNHEHGFFGLDDLAAENMDAAMQVLQGGDVFEREVQMKRRSGALFWCRLRGVAIEPNSPADGSIWIVLDIDHQKKTEQRLQALNEGLTQRVTEETGKSLEKERLLIQQGRNAAMGEMIGNIAHQWRQPLSTLGLVVQNINEDYQDGQLNSDELKKYVDTAMRAIQRMSCTIDDFRDFFRPSRNSARFSIHQSVNEAIQLLDAMLKNNGIAIVLKGDPELKVYGHANEFSQVVLNLMINAKDALVERKTPKGQIVIQLDVGDDSVMLRVRDNAGGIDGDLIEKIFDPYFTTKSSGTGIGLYMCKIIIEHHMGGSIACCNLHDAETRSGAEFCVTLPLRPEAADNHGEVNQCVIQH